LRALSYVEGRGNPIDWSLKQESMILNVVNSVIGHILTNIEFYESLATIIALITGGIWGYLLFIKRRQKYPRANVTHFIIHKPLSEDYVLVHVDLSISNSGEVLLSLLTTETRIQQILPVPSEVLDLVNSGIDPVKESETEIEWPLLTLRSCKWKKGEKELEPGETDQTSYDFILSAEIKTIEVYSYIKNITKRGKEIGWGITTVYDIGPVITNQEDST